jgi:hypothetical protein
LLVLSLVATACDVSRPTNPYTTTGVGGAGTGGAGGGETDPELGGPCVEDAQCDDGIDCTIDACDQTLKRCRFKGDSSLCANGVHCDGDEVCDQKLGCVPGAPATCTDTNVCTIDTCVEETQSCTHVLRDADQDGDPDVHCGGGDCDDDDPLVSSTTDEVCANGVDDDCDGTVDEADCIAPEADTCLEPLIVDASGSFAMDSSGAAFDYPTSCASGVPSSLRDVVAAVTIPPGPPMDVVARARTQVPGVDLAIAGQCGDPSTELACSPSFTHPTSGQVSRIHARGLGGGASAVPYPLYVTTNGGGPVTLDVSFEPATTKPTNETCGTAAPLALDTPTEIEIVDADKDLETACASTLGELVYVVTLTEDSDLDLYAASVDGDGWPSISLRGPGCALPDDEITCATNGAPHVFRHALPAGDYFVAVSATAPTTLSLTASASAPTAPPDDEDCTGTATLTPGVTVDVSMTEHQDDISLGCFGPATDAAYGLSLPVQSDVLLVQRISSGDTASVQLSGPACDGPSSLVTCAFGAKSPIRTKKRGAPAGDYRVVAESSAALPQQLTAFTRPTKPAVLVPFADACADAVTIPATGGFLQGNTSNLTADFSAGCDQAGGPPNGAKDQLLKLVLTAQKRVVFDMAGSAYDTLLDVRKGPACPGTEVPVACSVGYGGDKSYLDLLLDAGTYYVQVDGLNGSSGLWSLDVFVVDP